MIVMANSTTFVVNKPFYILSKRPMALSDENRMRQMINYVTKTWII
jgi:hypothetical protein